MVDIRRIRSDDKDDVRGLINDIMSGEFSKENKAYSYQDLDNLTEHYGGDRDIFLVAEKDGKVIGTAAIKEDSSDSALLRRIFVHRDYRGKGYGRMLLNKAMEFCFDHNYKTVSFRGTDKMQTALRLCLKNGFKQENIAEVDDFKLVVLKRNL